MTLYEIEYTYDAPDGGYVVLEAEDVDEADQLAVEHVKAINPLAKNIIIETTKEIEEV